MSDFKTASPETAPLDPHKRVRYTEGLVLGVQDFNQDQVYFMERDRLHQRSLHGYGVISGLDVLVEKDDGETQLRVTAGIGVTPRGTSVCIPQDQCADLDDWLERHAEELGLLGSPPNSPPKSLRLWVLLCPRECETDPVPVLGDPCRTPEDATVPSRIADDFELKLSLEPPERIEDDAVRRFGELLRSLRFVETADSFLDLKTWKRLVRKLLPGPDGKPQKIKNEVRHVHPDQADRFLKEAWRVWVREVRPHLADGAEGCADGGENCISLIRLVVELEGQAIASVRRDFQSQPMLLHTRLLQEWLSSGLHPPSHGELSGLGDDDHKQYLLVDPESRNLIETLNAGGHHIGNLAVATQDGQAVRYDQAIKRGDAAGGDLRAKYPNPRVRGLQGRTVHNVDPGTGEVLTWDGENDRWHPASVPVPSHSNLPDLDKDDHKQYLLVDPDSRTLIETLNAGGHHIGNLAVATQDGQAVRYDQAIKRGDDAGGDLRAKYPNPRVRGLQGHPVANEDPQTDEVLTWNGEVWIPRAPQASGPTPDLLQEDLTRIVGLSWEHGETQRPHLKHDGNKVRGVALAFGKTNLSTPYELDLDLLSAAAFQVWERFLEVVVEDGPSYWRHMERTTTLIPAKVIDPHDGFGRIMETESVAGNPSAIVLLFSGRFVDLPSTVPTPSQAENLLRIEVFGDHLLDIDGRAVDVDFMRSKLPTGGPYSFGIEGGHFESWFTAGDVADGPQDFDVVPINFNIATQDELKTLPGIGPALAERIVESRETEGPFTRLDDLRRVSGISDSVVEGLRRLRETDNPTQ